MRTIHRVLAVLTGLFLVAGLTSVTAPANAAEKIAREITIKGTEPKPNKFVLKGRVTPPTGTKINAIVQFKECGTDSNCKKSWKTFRQIKTNNKGRYTQQVRGLRKGVKRVYYRVKTKPNDKYKGASSQAVYIHRIY
ncbi:hypothetical protein I601_0769 [Nocardioides dokdonensis FR1436]|uniref:Uncharacterized protein n=1 Tax=Nocardioides dokdonensis FR1436 TaxID=1300347 RepID=A0A1A9GIE3_9ACTN|nr:hypothetical protein [Nocardioides dokdonensis]ANH37215.1 hypothetical protein I601_0769 [Nocardioides dokdonensis FR1436]